MNDNLKLTDETVLAEAEKTLAEHLPLTAKGYQCQTADLLKVLLALAVCQGTIEAICAEMASGPQAETIRSYVKEQLTVAGLPELEVACNATLAARLPARLWRQPQDIAMDFHDRPYYGKRSQEEGLWVRGKAQEGTTRFYRIATAYVIHRQQRCTLAICFVLPGMATVEVVQRLQRRLCQLQLQARRLLLDRGFASIEVMCFLEQQRVPALIACPIRGKQGGTRALCIGRKSYRTQYTFCGAGGRKQTVEMVICRAFTTAKRAGRLRKRATWYLFILVHLDLSPRQVRRFYRRRFGIETSYRCAAQVRGWTTSPNPAFRFLLMALAFFLLNLWAALRWAFCQCPRRGGRYLDAKRFRLARFANFIFYALQRHYGFITHITASAPPIA